MIFLIWSSEIRPHSLYLKLVASILAITFQERLYAAASQILNDNFFQNPAELSLVNKLQLIGGNAFLAPTFKFTGNAYGITGNAKSKATNSLPYLLSAYRFNERYVFGINVTPSSYAHLNWPVSSIVAQSTTQTKVTYYRVAAQSSYQLTPKLAMGLGLNLEYNKQFELNYFINGLGNQVSQASDRNFTADFGLLYKINPKNLLTTAIYTSVNTLGGGTSVLGNTVSNNFALTISQAPVAFIGLQHLINDKWSVAEKIYWSGWSLQKNLIMSNTATGTAITPTNWKDIWSLQLATRYATSDRVALLVFSTYDTNPINAKFNQIGYPLAPFGSLAAGFDFEIKEGLSSQVIYGYGGYVPSAKINNLNSTGAVSLTMQSATARLTYKA